jgi:murein DD-endopeptidase MepM/ murein hydrolase activator NlpD
MNYFTRSAVLICGMLLLTMDASIHAQTKWLVSGPASAKPGECAIIKLSAIVPPSGDGNPAPIALARTPNGATVTLVSSSHKAVAVAEAFGAGANGGFPLMAALALDAELKPGRYTIETTFHPDGETVRSPFTLNQASFKSETIRLNAANAAIKLDTSPARLAQIDSLNAILFSVNSSAPRFLGPFAGPFEKPLPAMSRTSFFADKRIYRYPNKKSESTRHWGVDFGVPTGTPVLAPGGGRVVMAEFRISTGGTLVIEHAPGIYSLYYHLDVLRAETGDAVSFGDVVALSGNTGLSTGAHLHWEFRVNGTAVSPDWFVGRTLGGSQP